MLKKIMSVCLSVTACLLMLGCSNTPTTSAAVGNANPQSSLQTVYAALDKTTAKVFTLAPPLSTIRIYAFRAGTAAKMGHNHVLSSSQFKGFVYLPQDEISTARFDLEFRLDELEIDNPDQRAKLGDGYSSVLTENAIKRTRDHMLGKENLQAQRFPLVRIHSIQIAGEIPKLAVKVQVELHGQQREIWLPLNVENLPNELHVTGSLVLRQTDFGIHPYSILGGLLAIQDEVIIEFSLVGTESDLK